MSKDQAHGQIEPALSCPDVADVSPPFLIWSFATKVLIQNVEGNRTIMVAVGCPLKPALLVGFQAILTHQTRHTVQTYG